MRRLAAPLLIFLVILTPLIAYSVYMPVTAVDPLGKPEMTYRLGKNNIISDRNEVRSVSLTTSGTTVTSATVQIYVRNAGWYDVTVVLRDSDGNIISTGSPPLCVYLGSGLGTVSVPMSPQVSIDSVYTVEASASRLFTSCII
jgi:hypothetical protein